MDQIDLGSILETLDELCDGIFLVLQTACGTERILGEYERWLMCIKHIYP